MTLRSPRNEFVRRALLALAPAVIVLLATAGSASAATSLDSIMQDDRLFGNPATQEASLDTADALGVDVIHTIIGWRGLAPSENSRRKPRGFNAADPGDYDEDDWDRFDDLVRGAQSRGIQILMSPAGPLPRWASQCPRPGRNNSCRPNPDEYEDFVAAVSKRYSGRYNDENQGGGRLPKVQRISFWNEPNLTAWIEPQRGAGSLYRELVYAGERGVRRGRWRGQIYIGETAPLNNSLKFWEEFFCIDRNGRTLTNSAARRAGCNGRRVKRFKATGIAHHPYTRGGGLPFRRGRSTDLTLWHTNRLVTMLDNAARRGAIRRNIPIYFTEFGVSTRPPDRKFGVTFGQQAEGINRAELIAHDHRRVRGFTQFQLSDDIGIRGRTFQTGLRTREDEEKPSFGAYRMPLFVIRDGGNARVWGGVRPGAGQQVEIQTGSGNSFTTVRTVTVNSRGFIDETIPNPSGDVRLRWVGPNNQEFFSREADVESERTITIPSR
jgi:hypothetical protein